MSDSIGRRSVTLTLPHELIHRMDKILREDGLRIRSRSHVVSMALQEWLERHDKEKEKGGTWIG
jgi:metal-responsive CopG/Arc/MetJ family transcriptional regulator